MNKHHINANWLNTNSTSTKDVRCDWHDIASGTLYFHLSCPGLQLPPPETKVAPETP